MSYLLRRANINIKIQTILISIGKLNIRLLNYFNNQTIEFLEENKKRRELKNAN